MDERSRDRLRELARRAEHEPFFLASALKEYTESEGMNDEDLARFLKCPTEVLDPVRLCRRPASASPEFRRDVERIAGHFGLNMGALAQILRQVDVVAKLRQEGALPSEGELRAARDREPESGDPGDRR